jgi:hypothetical protein
MTWIMLKLILVDLETMLMSTQDRCIVCADRVIGLEIILGAQMELLRYVGQVKARLGLFADSVHLDARHEHGLCRIYHRHGNLFGHTRW